MRTVRITMSTNLPVLPLRTGVVLPEGSFGAFGSGGHYCLVIPPLDLVIVHRVDTDQAGRAVNRFRFGELLRLILDARRPRS